MRLFYPLAGLVLLTTACATTASSSGSDVQPAQPRVIEAGLTTSEAGTRPRVVLKENVRKDTYAVSGDTASELRDDLDRKRPLSSDGRRFDANVQWSLTWSFHFESSPGACGLKDASVDLQVAVQLPVLAPDADPSDTTRDRWDAFTALLETHEAGHVDNYRDGARALRDAYAAVEPAPACEELRAQLSEVGASVIDSIRAADIEYDARTDHGRLQGATFP